MRWRWHVPDGLPFALFVIWMFGWLPIFITLNVAFGPCDSNGCGMNGPGSPAAYVFLAVWFGVVIVPALSIGCFFGLAYLWSQRPRRVTEPVVTDLRAER